MDNKSESGMRAGCPYFLQNMQACGLHSDGIYLPPRAHVLTYCLTPYHQSCVTFERYCFSGENYKGESSGNSEGRRRFLRIAGNRRVLIRSCDPLGIVTGEFEAKATTLDYSRGGMRIITEKEIPRDSYVLFDFGEDFPIPGLQGVAELCWHRKRSDNAHRFEAGLTFKDNFSRSALALELEE
ncbi:MAG: PilZ domain-containing protein [Desulfosalsimonas sp.]